MFKRAAAIVLTLVLLGLLFPPAIPLGANSGGTVAALAPIQAAGRGNPWINLLDGEAVPTTYDGPAGLVQALATAQPRALTADDFDEDGMPDLAAGYAAETGGLLALHRGSIDYLWPDGPEADARRAAGLFVDAPFLPDVRLFALPAAPDFLGAGDFDNDGHRDIVAAARGDTALYLLPGDGHGGFGGPEAVALPGAVTAFAAGEVNRRDGLQDLVVAVTPPLVGEGSGEGSLLVFEGPTGALRWEPEAIELPAPATSLAIGQMDDHYAMDIAAACSSELVLVHGRDRRLSVNAAARAAVPAPAVSGHVLPYPIVALALGDFVPEAGYAEELALLAADGVVHFVEPTTAAEITQLPFLEPATCNLQPATCLQLATCNVSALPGDDLAVLDLAGNQVHLVVAVEEGTSRDEEGAWETVVRPWEGTLDTAGSPAAVLPMRLNPDAFSDLVILQEGLALPTVVPTAPLATFTVESTGEGVDTCAVGNGVCAVTEIGGDPPQCMVVAPCTLRAAVQEVNALAGPNTIAFNIGGGTPSIVLGSKLPTISHAVTILGNTGGAARVQVVSVDGLNVTWGDSTIRSLVLSCSGDCGSNPALSIASGHVVEGNYLGTDRWGTSAQGYYAGLNAMGSDSTIGGTTAAARNVISGNDVAGIRLGEANRVQGNYIGTDRDGLVALGNQYAMYIYYDNNTVGGTVAAARNVVSGNTTEGVYDQGNGNLVQGNYIGTDASGTAALGNDGSGVYISGATAGAGSTVGGTAAGARNVISGNRCGVELAQGTGDNLVQGNYIGTDVNGTAILGNLYGGVFLQRSTGDTIGGTAAGAGNIISSNGQEGIIGWEETYTITIQGNSVGVDAQGEAMGNIGYGVRVLGSGYTIGGTEAGAGNVIAHNAGVGVSLAGSGVGNRISANAIFADGFMGIDLPPIGGSDPNDPGDADFGSANNGQNWPELQSLSLRGGQVQAVFRVDSAPANSVYPLQVEFFLADTFSDTAQGKTYLGSAEYLEAEAQAVVTKTFAPLYIPSNGAPIVATATDAEGNTSEFSSPPILFGMVAITVNSTGDLADNSPTDSVCWTGQFLPGDEPECTLRAALQTANVGQSAAIVFDLPGTAVPTIRPLSALPVVTRTMFIDGTTAEAGGVELDGSQAGAGVDGLVLRADYCTVQGFIVNRFSGNGISITTKDHNTVRRNFIGTDTTGKVDQGNGGAGIRIVDSSSNTIGGTDEAYRNVIAGNEGSGVEIVYQSRVAIWNKVQGNYIGMGADGLTAVGNGADGVLISNAFSNTVGGTVGTRPTLYCTGACNLISGNGTDDGHGVHIVGNDADWNVVQGNFIGVNDNGLARRPNRGDGILLENAPRNLVGGTIEAARNVISGNGSNGIEIVGSGASGNTVQGNFIGIGPRGEASLYNGTAGLVVVGASSGMIGGTESGMGNTIAYNKSGGVIVLAGRFNGVLGNSIHSNGYMGIELGGDGWSRNDAGDGDSGANDKQNFPALQYITVTGGTTTFSGTLHSQAGTTYRVEFFGSTTCSADGLIQGQTYLGHTDVTTGDSGRGGFKVTFTGSWPIATATASDPYSNTSEFAPPDISVTGVEVTQAVQNLANAVTLVTGKSTLARVFVRTRSCDVTGVTAALSLDGVDPQEPINGPLTASAQPLVRPSADERSSLDYSLNLVVPTAWLDESGGLLLTVEVNPGCVRPDADCDEANQRDVVVTLSEERPLPVIFWNVYWRAYPFGPVHSAYDEEYFSPVLMKSLMEEMYPIPEVQPTYLNWPGVLLTNWPAPTAAHYAYMIGKLEKKAKAGWVTGAWPQGALHYAYWGDAESGLGNPWGVGATGGTSVSQGVWDAAHELGHLLGSWHVDCWAGTPGAGTLSGGGINESCKEFPPWENYPYLRGLFYYPYDAPQQPATMYGYDPGRFFKPKRGLVAPAFDVYDIMSYGDSRWISDYSWDKFRLNRALRLQLEEERSRTYGPGEYILVSGMITPTLGTAQLDPAYRLADVPTTTLPISGGYAVELWAGDTLLAAYPFSITPGLHPPAEGEPLAPFVLLAPYVSGTTHLDLVSGTLTLVSRTVSAHAPAVTMTYPLGGEVLSGTVPVSWEAGDADGDALAYALLYSADDGQTWLPLLLDWPTTTVALSTTLLAGSSQGRLQVWATDGVNTGVDVTAAFTVPTQGPSLVTIVFPEDGGHYPADRLTMLQGGAWDPEDGVLTGTALLWTDSVSGTLGTGEELWVPLSTGWHTVTLMATDSEGRSAAASVTFRVGYEVFLPLVRR